MVEGGQQVIGGDARTVAADHLPIGRVAPTLVQAFQGVLVGLRFAGEGQRTGGAADQAAKAGQFHVQPLGQITQAALLARLDDVQAHGAIDRLARQCLAVPFGDGRDGKRQAGDHFRVVHAAPEQGADGHQEGQQEKHQQGQDQRLGLQPIEAFGAGQTLLETGTGDGQVGDRHYAGHGKLRMQRPH
ncbi:hypothetical protein D3C86_1523290 [compost metagenome]